MRSGHWESFSFLQLLQMDLLCSAWLDWNDHLGSIARKNLDVVSLDWRVQKVKINNTIGCVGFLPTVNLIMSVTIPLIPKARVRERSACVTSVTSRLKKYTINITIKGAKTTIGCTMRKKGSYDKITCFTHIFMFIFTHSILEGT